MSQHYSGNAQFEELIEKFYCPAFVLGKVTVFYGKRAVYNNQNGIHPKLWIDLDN